MAAARGIGIVLGGGGLTGTAFHAGVIAALYDVAGWDARTADLVVGTSAGSTAAALLRADLHPHDYLARMTGAPLSAAGAALLGGLGPIGQGAPARRAARRPASPGLLRAALRRPWSYPPGVVVAGALPAGTRPVDPGAARLAPLFGGWPASPTWITAVRLADGRRVLFGRDADASMADAVAASCAIPGYFEPVVIDGEAYVDGGAWSANNLDVAGSAGLAVVVVSAPMSTADVVARDPANLLRVPVRRRLDRDAERLRRAGTAVRLLHPDAVLRRLMGVNSMDGGRRAAVAAAVRERVGRQLAAEPLSLP